MAYTISIITITYNPGELLEGTIKSVKNQTYPHIEYLVIDGGSTDGTLEVIRKYESEIAFWISEPDKGLYDAMNKGLNNASGDFVLFLNAGDQLHEKNTIEKVFAKATDQTDILYGEVMLVNDKRKALGTRSELTTQKLPSNLNWKSLRFGMVVSHQAFIPRKEIARYYKENNLSADIDWVIRCLKKSRETIYTGVIISDYLVGGISKKRHRKSLWDRFLVLSSHYGPFQNIIHHVWIIFRSGIHKFKRKGKVRY